MKNLKKRKRQLEREGQYKEATQYDFFPVSYTLPREYAMFVEVRGRDMTRLSVPRSLHSMAIRSPLATD